MNNQLQTKWQNFPGKWIRWGLSSLAAVVLIILASGFVVTYFFQEEIKGYVLAEINKNLNSELKIGPKVQVSFLKKFPYTSVKLEDVYLLEVNGKTKSDTLFSFDDVFLQFNLIDVIRENYTIRTIQAEDGKAFVKIDQSGKGNFDIFKKLEKSSTLFSIKLDDVYIKNLQFSYSDKSANLEISGLANEMSLSGQFANNKYNLDFLLKAILWKVNHKGSRILSTKRIRLEGLAKVDNSKKEYQFEDARIKIADLAMFVNGKVVDKGEQSFLDLNFRGKDLNIGSILSLVPESFTRKFHTFKSTGIFYFTGNISGLLGKGIFPSMEGSFGIKNGELITDNTKVPVRQVNLTGYYSNGRLKTSESSRIEIKNFHAEIGKGFVNGRFYAENFSKPSLKISVQATVELDLIHRFMPTDTLIALDGLLKLDMDFKTRLAKPWSIELTDFKNALTSGSLLIKDVNFSLKNNPNDFKDFDGEFYFKGNQLNIKSFSGFISKSDFTLNGYFRNVLPYFFLEGTDFYMNATLTSDRLDVDELLERLPVNKPTDTLLALNLPKNAELLLLLDVEQVKFRKFIASNLAGNMMLSNRILTLNGLNMEVLGGEMSLSGRINGQRPSLLAIQGTTSIRRIDIGSLFESMDNFGQEYITSKNLKGFGSIAASFSFPMGPKLNIQTDQLVVESNLLLEKGELVNFMPLSKLAGFIRLEELENIQFATLQNHISIKDKKFIIPQMEVNNNVLNLRVEGTHDFENQIDYHVRLQLGELLAKKFSKNETKEVEEELDEGGRTSVFVKLTGKANNPTFSYDLGGVKQKLKADLKNEKRNIRNSLRAEFTKAGRDSAYKTDSRNNSRTRLKVVMEEEKVEDEKKLPPLFQAESEMEKNTREIKPEKTQNNGAKSTDKDEKVKVDWE